MDIVRIVSKCVPILARTTFVKSKNLPLLSSNRWTCCKGLHTTTVKHDMSEFFDLENFDEEKVNAGRPWRKAELRLKSNEDLHKLWYVLLKERNLLLTMQEMYEAADEPFNSPERTFKVEESMENILKVVKERNIAVEILEKGATDEHTPMKVTRNVFGLPIEAKIREHHKPKHESVRSNKIFMEYRPWMKKYMALYEEKLRLQRSQQLQRYKKYNKRLMEEHGVEKSELPPFRGRNTKLKEFLRIQTRLNDHGDGR